MRFTPDEMADLYQHVFAERDVEAFRLPEVVFPPQAPAPAAPAVARAATTARSPRTNARGLAWMCDTCVAG